MKIQFQRTWLKITPKNTTYYLSVCVVYHSSSLKMCLLSRFHKTSRKWQKSHLAISLHSPHDVVIDLHEWCGSIEAAQICIHHFSGAHTEQGAPVKPQKETLSWLCSNDNSVIRSVYSYHSEGSKFILFLCHQRQHYCKLFWGLLMAWLQENMWAHNSFRRRVNITAGH